MELLRGLAEVTKLGYPVLFGISRKRVVDSLLGSHIQAARARHGDSGSFWLCH